MSRSCGHVATYNAGCRCENCRAAAAHVRARSRAIHRPGRRYPSGLPGPGDNPEWMDNAACKDHPVDVFFPTVPGALGPAKAICASCDVSGACLSYALSTDQPDGCWGGLGVDERERIRRTA